MAPHARFLKLYRFFTKIGHNREAGEMSGAESKVICMVAGIAIAMFIGLFGWGADYFGWHDPTGRNPARLGDKLHPGRRRQL
jgi:hypothetical protein